MFHTFVDTNDDEACAVCDHYGLRIFHLNNSHEMSHTKDYRFTIHKV